MAYNRQVKIGNDIIQEYYKCGQYICWVNGRLSDKTFNENVKIRKESK